MGPSAGRRSGATHPRAPRRVGRRGSPTPSPPALLRPRARPRSALPPHCPPGRGSARGPPRGRAGGGARRHPRPLGKPGRESQRRARAASSAVSNPAGEEGIAATSQPEGSGGAGPPAGLRRSRPARVHPPPRVPAAPGNVGHGAERPHVSPPAAAPAPIM